MKTYVINLDRSPDRWEAISARLNSLGISPERFVAVDGSKISDDDWKSFCLERPNNIHPWTKGQMGCFLSHYSLWKIAAESPDSHTAILEDDLFLSNAVGQILANADWIPADADITRFEASNHRVRLARASRGSVGGRQVRHIEPSYNTRFWAFGAGSYIVSRDAARRLVALPPERHCNADIFLFNTGASPTAAELRTYQVWPAASVQYKRMDDPNMSKLFPSAIEDESYWRSLGVEKHASLLRQKLDTLWHLAIGYRKLPIRE